MKYGGHSARVEMRLLCDGNAWRVVQLGPDFLHLQHPVDYPPCIAEFVFDVDGEVTRWPVRLPNGLSSKTQYAALE